jgi:hypothetical protein
LTILAGSEELRHASVDSRVVLDLGGGAGGFVLPLISMTTLRVGSEASKELKVSKK